MSTHRTTMRIAGATGAVVLSVALTACGGAARTDSSTGSAPAPASTVDAGQGFNDADVRFAQMMIPHHRQAVTMADLAEDRAQSPEVQALAQQIKGAQDPEIATMTGFLQAWGAEVPDGATEDSMGGMDHGGTGGVSGMMTPEQMALLSNGTGTEFDRMFLQMMIIHHEGAVSDAEREQADGVNPEAKALAADIVTAQTEEITRMQQLLQGL